MSLIFTIFALSLTASFAKNVHEVKLATEIYPNGGTVDEGKIEALLDTFNAEIDAKLNVMDKNISQKLTSTLVVKLEEYIANKHTDLENRIKELEHIIERKLQTMEKQINNLNKRGDIHEEMIKTGIDKMAKESLKLNVTIKDMLDQGTALFPGKPHIEPGERMFSIIEIDQTATAYKQLVKKKDSVDVSLKWTTEGGAPADISRVKLNGTEVWTSSNNATSASFKVRKGGRYQMAVELCNKKGCNISDAIEIVIADTDGSHLPPLESSIGKNNKQFNQTSGKVVGAYLMEWGVHYNHFSVERVPVSNLTHLLYSLIPICGGDGINDSLKKNRISYNGLQNSCKGQRDFTVSIQDTRAAIKLPLNFSSRNEPYNGNFGHLMMLKQAKPELKILMSVGGISFSDPFILLSNKTKRDTFIASVKDFLQTWKFFDGVDIMWIFPDKDSKYHTTYVQLMKELREMLNGLSLETSKNYELTSAISAKWDKMQVVDYSKAQEYIDHIFLMSYNFKEPSDSPGHYASLYAPTSNPQEKYTVDYATKYLLAQGVKPEKIVLGLNMLGIGWSGVHNYKNNDPFTGKSTGNVDGTWETGRVYYKQIANEIDQGKWEYHYDSIAEAPYVFRKDTGDLITYEDKRSTLAKSSMLGSTS